MSKRRPRIPTTLGQKLPQGGRLLLCVSGGVDSMALLHGINSIKRLRNLELQVVHVDHQVRKNSKKDAKLVERTCKDLKIPFHLVTLDPKKQKGNFEAWARSERYKAFSKIIKSKKLDFCVTAHHANDVAETFLMRIISNKELNSILEIDKDTKVIRPLLTVTREEIEEYAKHYKVSYREDETNNDTNFLRNRIRKKLIPYIQKNFDKSIVYSLVTRARLIGDDERFLQELAFREIGAFKGIKWGSASWVLKLKRLLGRVAPEIGWRCVEELFSEKLNWSLGYAKSQEFIEWFNEGRGAFALPQEYFVQSVGSVNRGGLLRFTRRGS